MTRTTFTKPAAYDPLPIIENISYTKDHSFKEVTENGHARPAWIASVNVEGVFNPSIVQTITKPLSGGDTHSYERVGSGNTMEVTVAGGDGSSVRIADAAPALLAALTHVAKVLDAEQVRVTGSAADIKGGLLAVVTAAIAEAVESGEEI